MQMQGTAFQTYRALSGNSYTASAAGILSNVVANDVLDMLQAGCVPVDVSMSTLRVPLTSLKNIDGSAVAASPTTNVFGYAITLGTDAQLIGENAKSNTKTDVALLELVLPADFNPATNATLGIDCVIEGTGTAGTKTLDVEFYKCAEDGTQGSDLCATAAQNMATTRGTLSFTITGASLSPGDRCMAKITTALQETGGSANVNAAINSIKLTQ